jgi:hypothetical protein
MGNRRSRETQQIRGDPSALIAWHRIIGDSSAGGRRQPCAPASALQNEQNASIIRRFKKEFALRVLGTIFLSIALIELCTPASASEALPESGEAKLAAYLVCHPLAAVDMGSMGSESSTECNGIVKNLDGQKPPDNLAIRCLEATSARSEGYKYAGTCVQTDDDGDKLFMTYEGSKSGEMKWIGGTGKYKDANGSGTLGVVVAPSSTSSLFAYTLNYNVTWARKPK